MTESSAKDICNIPVFDNMEQFRCCGCEACVNVCPEGIISMQSGEYGFRYPYMDAPKCIRCQKCVRVCPELSPVLKRHELRESYAGYVLDENIVLSSSSGGFFTVLANAFLKKADAYIAAVVWAEDFRSAYHICGGKKDIERMKRSKYIQSRKNDIYKIVESKLNQQAKVLFVGCPCEVAALKNYLGKSYDGLYCIDIVCQGPTSESVMNEYADMMEQRFKSKISDLNLRYVGGSVWIPQWLNMRFKNGKQYLKSYYRTPLGIAFHMMQRPSCYHCKFAGDNRYSDLTLGDFHGIDEKKAYYNPNGTSVIIVNTQKGKELMESLSSVSLNLESVGYDEVVKPNPRIVGPWKPYEGSEKFWKDYKKYGLAVAARKSFSLKRWLPFVVPHKIKTWLMKIKHRNN